MRCHEIEKGLIYHVINRGNNRQDVFSKPGDYEAFLQAIRRSVATGLPCGSAAWIKKLSRKLNLDLNIRPRGQPKKEPIKDK